MKKSFGDWPFLRFLRLLCIGFVSSLVIASVPGFAQSERDDASVDTLEEITVTARRRDESLQQAPLAITAMERDFLAAQRIQSMDQVLESTPGATFTVLNKGQFNFSIRGVGSQGEGAAADSAVMTVVDDVVIGKDFLKSLKIYDVNHVEILRGPQGTAFGRNAAAGAIHIVNNTPIRAFESYFESTFGSQSLIELNGAISGAIGDSAAGRLSFHFDDVDGYTTDLGTGRKVDGESNTSIRGQILLNPSDSFEILVRAEYSEDDDGNRVRRSQDCTQPYIEPPFGDYTDPCDLWVSHTSEATDGPFFFKRDISSLSATVHWNVTDAVTLTSITSYIDANASSDLDNFGTPDNVVYSISTDDASQLTQEIRVDNYGDEARTNWMVGLYLYADDHDRSDGRDILMHFGPPFATQDLDVSSNETNSMAIFGQLEFGLSDKLNLTIGGRYTRDEKDFEILHTASGALADIFLDPAEDPIVAAVSDDWSNFSGSVSLRYALSDSSTLYGLVSQGYKSGGFNGEPYTLEAATTPYDEETSLNVEVGAKMDLASNRVRLNLSAFILNYDDLQVEGQLPSGTPYIQNASGADVTGIEAEFTWLANEYLTLMGSYAGLDAELKGQIGGVPVDGFQPPNAPDWTATFAAQLDFPLSNGSHLGFRADYRSRGTAYDSFDETLPRRGVDIIGARFSWTSESERWFMSVWGRNITDEAEIVSIGPLGLMSQNPTSYGRPRTYGATVRVSF